ncbi:hypothetical protein [Clostridium saccharoperbutylacetonicum]|uniref:hypothetical protein n=1 Tax=Clostridium saccharoperbutylacetonicum TaxID=36745 RepID=UPI0039ED72A4
MNKLINKSIKHYMNTLSRKNREYILDEIVKLKKSVYLEKKDRVEKQLDINFNSPAGRKEINIRTTIFAKEVFDLDVTEDDIFLFRKCKSMEAKDRKLIANLNDDDKAS